MVDWLALLAVVATLVPLVWLNRWIHQHLHGLAYLMTGHRESALILYALPLFPGVALHEFSHWLMAKVLGVKTSKLSLLPKRQKGGFIQLGAVTVQRPDVVRASLIGVAPLITGALVVLAIGQWMFGVGELEQVVLSGDLGAIVRALINTLRAPDAWLWLYLVFAVANAMLPSPSDRETWPPVLLFLGFVVGVAYLLGFTGVLLQIAPVVTSGLRWLALAFAVTLLADLPFVVFIAAAEWSVGTLRGQRVYYYRKEDNRRK